MQGISHEETQSGSNGWLKTALVELRLHQS